MRETFVCNNQHYMYYYWKNGARELLLLLWRQAPQSIDSTYMYLEHKVVPVLVHSIHV